MEGKIDLWEKIDLLLYICSIEKSIFEIQCLLFFPKWINS
jgi:hypothetical protein